MIIQKEELISKQTEDEYNAETNSSNNHNINNKKIHENIN